MSDVRQRSIHFKVADERFVIPAAAAAESESEDYANASGGNYREILCECQRIVFAFSTFTSRSLAFIILTCEAHTSVFCVIAFNSAA